METIGMILLFAYLGFHLFCAFKESKITGTYKYYKVYGSLLRPLQSRRNIFTRRIMSVFIVRGQVIAILLMQISMVLRS